MAEANSKKKRGRPPLYPGEEKTIRCIKMTERGWKGIMDKAAAEGLAASEFLERLGRDLSIVETSVSSRLRSFLDKPASVWWCWTEATRRYALQLGVISERSANTDDEPEVVEARHQAQQRIVHETTVANLYECLKKSMCILALINSALPDISLIDLMPQLRWIAFRIMLANANLHSTNSSAIRPFITESDRERDIRAIYGALQLLKHHSPNYYQIIEMEFWGRMSSLQIAKYRQLNTQHSVSKSSVRLLAKEAIFQLRSYIHKGITDDILKIEPFPETDPFFENIRAYYELCSLPLLNKESAEKLEQEFLKRAINDPKLDFWIREVDHIAGHHWLDGTAEWQSVFTNPEHHRDVHEEVRRKLEDEFPAYLHQKIEALDVKIMTARSKEEIIDILRTVVREESNDSFNLEEIPIAECNIF
jgi:hypothetical protein